MLKLKKFSDKFENLEENLLEKREKQTIFVKIVLKLGKKGTFFLNFVLNLSKCASFDEKVDESQQNLTKNYQDFNNFATNLVKNTKISLKISKNKLIYCKIKSKCCKFNKKSMKFH